MVRDDLMKGSSKRFIVAKSRIGNLEAIIVCQRELKLGIPLAMTALSKAATKLQTRNDIVLMISTTSDKFVSESMQGVSGFTHNDHTISILVNTESNKWKEAMEGTIAHEFSHVIRFQGTGMVQDRSLRASLAFEGLAQCFEEEITGKLKPWSTAISEKQAKTIWKRIKRSLDSESRDLYTDLFIRKDGKRFPHWAGYALGYLIVKKTLARNSKKGWKWAIAASSKELIGSGFSFSNHQ